MDLDEGKEVLKDECVQNRKDLEGNELVMTLEQVATSDHMDWTP